MQTKTLRHGRLRLELDRGQVVTDDPGQGTPALVWVRDGRLEYSGTYWCVLDNRETVDGVQLTDAEMEWLDSQFDQVEKFLYGEAVQ